MKTFIIIFLFVFFQKASFASIEKLSFFNWESESSSSPLKAFSFGLQSSFNLKKNNLIESPYSWSAELPYSEVQTKLYFLPGILLSADLIFSYQKQSWSFEFDNLTIQKEVSFLSGASWKAGYFFYPVSYAEENEKIFSKRSLIDQSLFPLGKRAFGGLFKWKANRKSYFQAGLQASISRRETDQFRKSSFPALSAGFVYEEADKKAFAGYFQKDFFLGGRLQSLGAGAEAVYTAGGLDFGLKAEAWFIKRSRPGLSIFSYYAFPFVKRGSFSFGLLYGQAFESLKSGRSAMWEYIIKADYFLAEGLWISIEKFGEGDSLVKESAWSASLKTKFKI